MHTSERQFECEICKKNFNQNTQFALIVRKDARCILILKKYYYYQQFSVVFIVKPFSFFVCYSSIKNTIMLVILIMIDLLYQPCVLNYISKVCFTYFWHRICLEGSLFNTYTSYYQRYGSIKLQNLTILTLIPQFRCLIVKIDVDKFPAWKFKISLYISSWSE